MTPTIFIGFYLLAGAWLFIHAFVPILRTKSYYAHKILNEDSRVFAACAIFFTTMWAPLLVLAAVISLFSMLQEIFKGEPK